MALKLTMTCTSYDRNQALINGTVKPDGIELDIHVDPVGGASCYKWLEGQRVHMTSMWFRALWEEERAAAGPDIYPWGFQKTRSEVDKILDYAYR